MKHFIFGLFLTLRSITWKTRCTQRRKQPQPQPLEDEENEREMQTPILHLNKYPFTRKLLISHSFEQNEPKITLKSPILTTNTRQHQFLFTCFFLSMPCNSPNSIQPQLLGRKTATYFLLTMYTFAFIHSWKYRKSVLRS